MMDSRNAQAFFTIANKYKNKRSGLHQSQSIISTKSKYDTEDYVKQCHEQQYKKVHL